MRGVTFAAGVFLVLALPIRATVDQDFNSATVLLHRAENLEQSGAKKAALKTYDDCYQKLQTLRAANPTWNTDAVGKEMAECFSKIDLLGPAANVPLPAVVPNDRISVAAASPAASAVSRTYPWKRDIVTTVFWIGEDKRSGSSWDPHWIAENGGLDDQFAMSGYASGNHASTTNPFYVALPFNDLAHPKLAARWLPAGWKASQPGGSACKDRWVEIKNRAGRTCFAQWEDVGPLIGDDAAYVFGADRPRTARGLNVSPAVAKYLGFTGASILSWRFVESDDVPAGLWMRYDEQAVLFQALQQSAAAGNK